MLNRRTFITRLAGTVTATAAGIGCAQVPMSPMSQKLTMKQQAARTVVYASEGKLLICLQLDPVSTDLTPIGTVEAAESIQFAVFHPSRKYLYAAVSNGGPGGRAGDTHFISTFFVDSDTGAVHSHGGPTALPFRPIHVTLDPAGEHLLVAFNKPAAVRVYRLNAGGTMGALVPQAADLDVGIFPHQITVAPSGKSVFVCGRGNDAAPGKLADIGTLTSFDFRAGVLAPRARLTFSDGIGPRDLEIHPSKPWVFIALERGNQLGVYALVDGVIGNEAMFIRDTPVEPGRLRPRQRTGTVHLHPNGKFAYVTNRADKTRQLDGKDVFVGGENNIAVFSIDQVTGEPTLIQHVDTRGIEPRTFVIAPGGRLLLAGNQSAMQLPGVAGTLLSPAGLAIFRIGNDGRLSYVRSRKADTSDDLIWTGAASFG